MRSAYLAFKRFREAELLHRLFSHLEYNYSKSVNLYLYKTCSTTGRLLSGLEQCLKPNKILII